MREDTAEVGVVDAGLMLSDDFVESHCFSLSRANGRTRLDFLPARSGAKGEKGGSFWLDAAALTLQQVDMKWNARGPIKGRGTQATLELTRTAEGYVIVRRWVVRVWDPFSRHVKEAGGEVVRWWIEGP